MTAFVPVSSLRLTSIFGASICCPVTTRKQIVNVIRRCPRAQLIGIPDHLRGNLESDPHDVLLAELRFSDPSRLPALVQNSLDMLDEDFYNYLEKKINKSADLEERETLRALRDAITSLMGQMLDAMAAEEKSGATEISKDEDASSHTPEEDARTSYDELIDTLVNSYESAQNDEERDSIMKAVVDLNYHRIDLRMLERLSERIVSAGDRAPLLASVRDAISVAMSARVTAATQAVKKVLSAGSLHGMRAAVDELARQGGMDDAFILLLQANIDEARKAGATQAVDILNAVLNHASEARDIMLDPEIRLIRKLLRMDDPTARMELLTKNLEPGGSVSLPDGTKSTGTRIDGKKFVDALRKLIEEFGNVDEQFVLKLSKIGEESEAVARKIYDMEGKDVQALQDEAFHKRSVSIWDLEEFEHQETSEGRTAPWEGRLGPIPEKMGFGQDGKLSL